MFDSPMGPLAVSASSSTGKVSSASTSNVPFEIAHCLTSQEPSLCSGQRGIYPTRSSPKLADYSTSTAQSSPVSPLVFADMSSLPGPPLNCDVNRDLDLSDLPAHKGNTIITFDPRVHRSNISAVVTEKAGKRLELDASDAKFSNKEPVRTINPPACTSGISTANSIKAPVVDPPPVPSMSHDPSRTSTPHISPLERIWSRLRHAVTKTLWKRSDAAGIDNSGGGEQGSRATRRMFAPHLTAGASSVRDQDVTRPRRLSKSARPASASVVPDPKCGISSQPKRLSKRSRPSNRTDIDFATIFSPQGISPSSIHILDSSCMIVGRFLFLYLIVLGRRRSMSIIRM
ncbi:hypothetical protein DFH29DRAFT_900948 [Suillus ampliporus]|nr:hypothetical protein DFH29DRAFT_900948 [Suillus ampliporus]